ncbi:MAG TPA: hypothetical protein VFT22_42620 [Kofleriaceae bacterium]|nr:hypothetical protein [Kofleriaceae bacterium]
MPTLKITEKALATLPPPTLDPGAPPGSKPKPQEYYWDTEIKGLGVVVGRTGVLCQKSIGLMRRAGSRS